MKYPLKNDLLKDKNGEWVTGNSNKNIGNITNIKTIKSYSKYKPVKYKWGSIFGIFDGDGMELFLPFSIPIIGIHTQWTPQYIWQSQ